MDPISSAAVGGVGIVWLYFVRRLDKCQGDKVALLREIQKLAARVAALEARLGPNPHA